MTSKHRTLLFELPFLHGRAIVLVASCLSLIGFGCEKTGPPTNAAPSVTSASETNRSYRYGTRIDFGQNANSARYQVSGWSPAEAESTWTEGSAAVLEFDVEPTDGPIALKVVLSGFVQPPKLPSQSVNILVNGEPIAHWEIAAKGEASTTIPASIVQKAGRLRIEFDLPMAASPASLGVSADNRLLGIRLFDLVLVKSGS